MAFLFAWTCSQTWSSRTKYPNEYFSTTYWQILQGLSNHKAWKKYTPPLSSLACPSVFLHKVIKNGRLNSLSIRLAGVSFELKQLYWQEGYWHRLQYYHPFFFPRKRCIKLTDSLKLKELLKIRYSILHRFIKLKFRELNTLNSIYFPDFYWQII